MTTHALLSASGAHRWMSCPASVKEESSVKRVEMSSPYAEEGTLAHALAEHCLVSDLSPLAFHGVDFQGQTIGYEMAQYIQGYCDYINAIEGEKHYELRLSFDSYVPGGFGTADCIVIEGDTLHVIDLKYGKGVSVDAVENPQLMLYGVGAYLRFRDARDIKRVQLHIYQPRASNVTWWGCDVKKLLEFARSARAKAALALSDNAPHNPSEKACLWCKAKATCKGLDKHIIKVLSKDFDELPDDKPESMSDDRISEILANRKLITDWLSAVEDYAKEKLLSGQTVTGWKLVEGRSLRAWKDEALVVETLTAVAQDGDIYERKLISPTKAEKLLGKKIMRELEHLIVKPSGQPTLVHESDKRPAITSHADDFENIA